MSDINDLLSRIDGALAAVKEKAQRTQQQQLQEYLERGKLLKEYEKVQAKIVEITKPRLEAFAKRSGDRVSITPSFSETRRSAQFEFRSPKAYITLSFSVAPDQELKNVVLEYNLKVVPVVWKFNSHAEFSTPISTPDYAALTKWLDDRIIEFVELYIHINESEIYDKAEYVEDPVAKVKFPKFAAGATLDHAGQTYFFIDNSTKADFAKQKGIV
ncbi:MAG: hypothetical protein C0467_07340 [Planctomycetaceae bacterium]|nr:hypothetical protein [Planctomycetaceae bacterium]